MSTQTTSTPLSPEYHTELETLYGTLCCTCFLLGVAGNTLSYRYFGSRRDGGNTSNTLYQIISLNDVLISLLILPVGISFLDNRNPGLIFGNTVPCYIWSLSWYTAIRLSVFLVAVLSSSRAITIIRPFAVVNVSFIVGVIATYAVLLLASVIFRLLFLDTASVEYLEHFAICILPGYTAKQWFSIYLETTKCLAYILPMVVVLLGGLASSCKMIFASQKATQVHLRRSRTSATVTIMLFTFVYLVFNLPLAITQILELIDSQADYTFDFLQFDSGFYFANFLFTVGTAMNSALNPIVYVWRMSGYRAYLQERLYA